MPASWERLPELTGEDGEETALISAPPPKEPEPETVPESQQRARVPPTPESKSSYRDPDMTYATQFDSPPPRATARGKPSAVVGRKPPAPVAAAKKVSLAAKKKRDVGVECCH